MIIPAEDLDDVDRFYLSRSYMRYYIICEACGKRFKARRSDKKTCDAACRKRLSRSKCDIRENGEVSENYPCHT
jgi:hypothetical protein